MATDSNTGARKDPAGWRVGRLVGPRSGLIAGAAAVAVAGLVALAAERSSSAADATESAPATAPSAQPAPSTPQAARPVPGEEVRGPGSYAFGYSVGADIGNRVRSQSLDLDFEQFVEGFRVAMTGAPAKYTDAQMQQSVEDLQTRQVALAAAAQVKRREENTHFLADNGKKPGIETTRSGLQYEVLTAGSGKRPGPRSLVVTDYEGRLLDGTVFDSSVARGTPAQFRVDGVIKGWQEALQAMHEGDKWRIWVPSELGYGSQGAGRQIPPDSVLVFELRLIDVKDENNNDRPARPPIEGDERDVR